ncbi:MAG: hypothetical protein M3457_09485 [Chloroflexota bacterium]|nr:hypothetical protein [Chloroflexota bacterium]
MVARPRQTAQVCEVIELTEDAAVRAHRLILLSWQNDGEICDREIGLILAATGEVIERASTGVTVASHVDATIAAGLSLVHNGYSPRSQRLIGELNVIEVDFRNDGPDDDPASQAVAALKAA